MCKPSAICQTPSCVVNSQRTFQLLNIAFLRILNQTSINIGGQILLLVRHSVAIESSHKGGTLLADMRPCPGLGPTQVTIESPGAEQLVCERQVKLIIKRNTFGPQN